LPEFEAVTSAPSGIYGQRVLRYAGDPTAAWDGEVERDLRFSGSVVAVAICDDTSSAGIRTYYLYERRGAADEWYETLDQALEGFAADDEVKGLSWVDVAP
jgi:hypothetical protein